jgi:hypothetical protein
LPGLPRHRIKRHPERDGVVRVDSSPRDMSVRKAQIAAISKLGDGTVRSAREGTEQKPCVRSLVARKSSPPPLPIRTDAQPRLRQRIRPASQCWGDRPPLPRSCSHHSSSWSGVAAAVVPLLAKSWHILIVRLWRHRSVTETRKFLSEPVEPLNEVHEEPDDHENARDP